ncbi:MAG: hypothetical protein ACKPBV_05130 [Sphaerospermopsis kisseleviana]
MQGSIAIALVSLITFASGQIKVRLIIMKVAIDLYYEKLHQESPVKPLQLLRESGLIGCAEGDSDLSVNYKQYLTESLNEKYGNR